MTRSALVVRGGWEGHSPVEATELFIPFLREQGFEVRTSDSSDAYADTDAMAATDLIVQSVSMGEITPDALRGLRGAVEAGTGLVGWHGGIVDSYRMSTDYLQLVGGQFATHPGTADGSSAFLEHTIEFTSMGHAHPVTEGLADFTLTTEQYWVLHDDLSEVLATTTHPAQSWQPWHRPIVSPSIWTRRWGAGRIVVATPGHSVDVLEHPSVRAIIERGMLWASR